MRAGWVVSAIGHIGFVMMTLLAWESRTVLPEISGAVVPVEIVDIAPESNVRALAMDVPDQEVAPEMNPEEPEETAPAPDAPPQRPEPRRPRFDPSNLSGMFDKQDDPGPRRTEGERADRNREGAGLGTQEVAAIEDRGRALVRAHMRRCWRMPADLPDPETYRVVIEFDLNRNGTLNGQPRVVSPTNYTFNQYTRRVVQDALRAIRQCDPYPFPDDPIVGEHYDLWRRQVYTFRLEQ